MKKVYTVGMIICALVLIFSLGKIGYAYLENYRGDQIHEAAQAKFLIERPESETKFAALPFIEPGIRVDVDALSQTNSDILGWIYGPGTIINYPLLAGVDNQKYLGTTFDQQKSKFGSIFIDMNNSSDLMDAHTIIYGHNINNGAMFGQLSAYRDQGYFAANRYLYIIKPEGYLKYEIFSARYTTVTEGVFETKFDNDQSFQKFLGTLKQPNYLTDTLSPTPTDKIITLSTCTSPDKKEQRFVVHAVLVANHLQ